MENEYKIPTTHKHYILPASLMEGIRILRFERRTTERQAVIDALELFLEASTNPEARAHLEKYRNELITLERAQEENSDE